jgi:site-specific DNA-methyltransferase (adenine-specific)
VPAVPVRRIILGDNLAVLPRLPDAFARLAYIDPPFNTRRRQWRDRMRVTAEIDGSRTGFGGRRYAVERVASGSFADEFEDYLAFLMPRIEAALHCLTSDASLFVHLDAREVHHAKVALDRLLGRGRFMNEIVWAYDYGARTKSRWPAKHDTILWYALDPDRYVFDFDAMDRLPYMAPGLVTADKAARGKTPTDVWWHTIVPTNGKEKTGYPTQKPLGILERIVKVHSRRGDVVLDFFAGSGTTGEAAARNGRGFVLIDANAEAVRVMVDRLARYEPECVELRGASLSASTAAAPGAASRRASARSRRPPSPGPARRARGPTVGR